MSLLVLILDLLKHGLRLHERLQHPPEYLVPRLAHIELRGAFHLRQPLYLHLDQRVRICQLALLLLCHLRIYCLSLDHVDDLALGGGGTAAHLRDGRGGVGQQEGWGFGWFRVGALEGGFVLLKLHLSVFVLLLQILHLRLELSLS